MNHAIFSRLILLLFSIGISTPSSAASEDELALARSFLRCAAFYVFGSMVVTGKEVKQELETLANRNLHGAELLLEQNRPLVKTEFDAARQRFFAETATEEVKADRQGFIKFMGEQCNAVRERNKNYFPAIDANGAATIQSKPPAE
jgi:hypothetical protein